MSVTLETSPRSLPAEEVLLPAVPVLPEPEAGTNLSVLMPLTGALGSVAMVVAVAPGGSVVRALVMAVSVLVSAALMVLVQVTRQRAQRSRTMTRAREEHLAVVARASADLRERRRRQGDEQRLLWPVPAQFDAFPGPLPDELSIRCGTTTRTATTVVVTDPAASGVPDPVCRNVAERFESAHGVLDDLPVVLHLRDFAHVMFDAACAAAAEVTGDVLRAWTLQAARLPAEDVAIAVLADADDLPRWDWVKWLPHTQGGADGRILLGTSPASLPRGEDGRPMARHLVVVDARTAPAAWANETTARTVLSGRRALPKGRRVLRVTLNDDATATMTPPVDGAHEVAPDRCTPAVAAAVARRSIAGRSPVAAPPSVRVPMTVDLRHRERDSLLKIVVGHDPDGAPVHLDLKESAHGGHGPHGLLVGATGSGKSEFLRTLVMGIITTHLPEDVALVLVDFKGGATFSDLDDLPHVAACVTNLAGAVGLVDRMQDAIGGEMERRQELLHTHGFPNVTAYRAARSAGADLAPLPHLFVCVDEFSELLTARPEFVELFTAVGRLGRSLGIHLLLASQRLDEGRLHALEAHLSYRIALRTFSASESRAAIGIPDAHALPKRPGVGLFRSGADAPVRFDAVHLGAPAPNAQRTSEARARVEILSALAVPSAPAPATVPRAAPLPTPAITLGEQLLQQLRAESGTMTPARRVWLPPLDFDVDLGRLVADVRVAPTWGLHSPSLREWGGMRLPIGLVDRPRSQRHDVLGLDLSGARGHVAVVGAPRSGRSTTVQTLVSALALARTPDEAHLHLVDLGGGALTPLTHLPHVVSHATRDTPDLLARVVEAVERTIEERERLRVEGAVPGPGAPPRPEVFVIVDGWGVLRAEHDDLERRLVHLAARALGAGVHLVLTAVRWSEMRPALLDVVGSRIELRLGDPHESVVERRAADSVPAELPGRGIVAGVNGSGPSATRIAQPRLFADPTLSQSPVELTCRTISEHWTRPRPARLRELPELVLVDDLAAPAAGRLRVGVDESARTVSVPSTEHVVLQGPAGAGRSSTLRRLVVEWTQAHTTGQVLLVDPRGTLEAVIDDAHLLEHASTAGDVTTVVRSVAEHLLRRETREGTDLVPLLVVVDDLELLRDLGGDLSPLVPLLARASTFGLTLAVAARTSPVRAPDRLVGLLIDLGASSVTLEGSRPGRATVRRAGHPETRVQVGWDPSSAAAS